MKFIYVNKDNEKPNLAVCCVATEIKNVIQNWRKRNHLPITYRIPTLCVYFKNDIIKTAIIEGKCECGADKHLMESCQVDKVVYEVPNADMLASVDPNSIYDFYCWSPLGGTIGAGDVLDDSENAIATAEKEKWYREYL